MSFETPVQYFYGDSLRWSFGFENPNKAAVLFACAVPLLWGVWQAAWLIKGKWPKFPALCVSAGLLAGAWYCLIMTFSRGGLVGAAGAVAYLIAVPILRAKRMDLSWIRSARFWLSISLIAALIGGAVWNGIGARSRQAIGNDASVGNRIELWEGALQMAVENPRGFGTGWSGREYMQWYQPLQRQEGYRTMVNSYLTFLVEQGLLWSLAVVLGFVLFWVWTKPGEGKGIMIALRGSIVAFLIAGIFSTTMEDWRLWILPVTCGLLLLGISVHKKQQLRKWPLLGTASGILACSVALLTAGILKSNHDPLKREFGKQDGFYTVTALGPRSPKGRSLGCLVDEVVLGDQCPKLLRELALGADAKILLGNRVKDADRILCSGGNAISYSRYALKPLFLLAPDKIPDAEITALAARSEAAVLLLPEIDEDGRVGFWDEVTAGAFSAKFRKYPLGGVGNRVDWAWPQVVELVKSG